MAKYTRYDPRNKKNGRNKNRAIAKDFKIRDTDSGKVTHRYKGNKITWVLLDEVEEESDFKVS